MKPDETAMQGGSNGSTTTSPSYWPEILAVAQDQSVQPTEFIRLILMEMSVVCHELRAVSEHSSLGFKLKPLIAQVHSLRTLAETIRYASELALQSDIVNLDGPKFECVLKVFLEIFKECVYLAGCDDHVCGTILRQFRAKLPQLDSELRGKMKEIDSPESA